MPNQSGKIILVLALFLLLIGAAIYFLLPGFKKEYAEQIPNPSIAPSESLEQTNKTSEVTKDYYSKALKISFKVPEDAKVEENNDLKIKLNKGKISVYRDGTNFANLKDFFEDLKQKNKWEQVKYSENKVGQYDGILLLFPDSEKLYLVYTDNWVYYFSTSDEALYPVLDKIVQSFKYKP